MLKKIFITAFAFSVWTIASAGDNVGNDTTDVQTVDASSSAADASDDSMADFRAVIDIVLAEKDRSELAGGSKRRVDSDSTTNITKPTRTARSQHREYLGLGFGHGVSSRNGNSQYKPNYNSTDRINPHNDNCRGNGHPGNPNPNGNNGNGNPGAQGQGHLQHGNGNGFGHRDCGEPSPSD